MVAPPTPSYSPPAGLPGKTVTSWLEGVTTASGFTFKPDCRHLGVAPDLREAQLRDLQTLSPGQG